MKATYRTLIFCLPCLILLTGCQTAKDQSLTVDDYQKAESFLSRNLAKKVYGLSVSPQWIKKGPSFWYRTNTRQGKKFFLVDPENKQKLDAFDHEKLAASLSQETGKTFTGGDLPFNRIKFLDNNQMEFEAEKKTWTIDLATYELTSKEKEEPGEETEEKSPDGKWTAFTRNNNLFIRSNESSREIQLSRAGKKLYEYATYLGWGDIMEGENGDRPSHISVEWSPDSKKIYTQILDLRQARKMYLLKSVNDDYRSQLLSYYRASPGDTNIAYYIPVIFDIASRREISVDLEPVPHFTGLDTAWFEDGSRLYARLFERGYKQMKLMEINAASGKVRIVAEDESPTTIETGISHYRILKKSNQALMTSERDGWNHIYRYDWNDGELLNQVTSGEYVVLNINHVDEDRETIYFTAVGREKGDDPYLRYLYKIRFDGTELASLTPEAAHHEVSLSPDHRYFIDNFSRAEQPTKSLLKNLEDGSEVMSLEEADISDLLALGWQLPEPFKVKAGDGETDLYGLIWKPTNFSPSKKYPVIDQSYTGPQAVATPKSFQRALMSSNTPLAELQFICITVDGRGTAQRSKAFHDFTYHNLGGGCEDHITALRQLAEEYSYLDIDRVGIYGHSAGGYDAARALLQWPDFYKVGVASSGNHDHRMAKAWWPEQYMGWPIGEFYEQQSNITNAGNLKGKLLLVHGEIDENVNPAATFRLVDALIKKNKDFDLLIIPASRHGYRGTYGDYFTRKRWDYFVRHLHGIQPPAYALAPAEENFRLP